MNCQELTELLDNGDLRNLPQAKRRELDAHLSGCADCAAEWRVQERIVMTPPMWVPAGFVAQCRQLVAAGAARLLVRRRVVLYSTLLVLAAAAALLAWRYRTPQASPAAVVAVPVIAAPLPAPPQVQAEAKLAPAPARPQPVKPPTARFTVYVRPLQIEGSDAEGNALATQFRDRVMALLQGVPNLSLVDAPAGSGAAETEYELRIKYQDLEPGSAGRLMRPVMLEVGKSIDLAASEAAIAAEARMSPEEQQRSQMARRSADVQKRISSFRGGNPALTLLLGQGTPTTTIIYDRSAPTDRSMPTDRLERAAQQLVRDLRVNVFPPDESFEQEELTVLRNPSQTQALRMRALGALLVQAERRGGFSHASPAVVRAGGEFALTAESVVVLQRSAIWDALALTGSPEVVPYLVRGLDEVAVTETRLQLVKILSDKFGGDPRAQAALAAAAKSNDQQTVRMAALRESGDPQWSAYVVATLMNSTLPDVQRLQPIADMAPGDMFALTTSSKAKFLLEDPQLRELGTLIIRIAPDSTASETTMKALLAAGAMETPAALDMLIEILHAIHMEDVPPGMGRASMMNVQMAAGMQIISRYAGIPKARTVIAELANSSEPLESMEAQRVLGTMNMKAGMEKSRQDQQSAPPPAR